MIGFEKPLSNEESAVLEQVCTELGDKPYFCRIGGRITGLISGIPTPKLIKKFNAKLRKVGLITKKSCGEGNHI